MLTKHWCQTRCDFSRNKCSFLSLKDYRNTYLMKLHYVGLLLILLAAYPSCNKPNPNNPTPNPGNIDTTVTPPKPADTIDVASNVYIVGLQSEDSFADLKYWNNGKSFTIDSVNATSITSLSAPTSIFVSGADVYILSLIHI